MALFKSSKSNSESVTLKDSISTATIITKGTTISGNITGNDTLHVDGDVEGSIKVDNIVVVGKSGMIQGDIEAHKIISSGHINGEVRCEELEVMESSTVKSKIIAQKVEVHGKIEGETLCETLIIELNGKVENTIQAKNVTVSGSLIGDVACELLSTKKTGFVKGSMYVSNISNEGGTVEGSIGQYKELISSNHDEVIEKIEEKATKKGK
jgi:cytoskeletal protein CcmA (bactofilin family)